MPYIPNEDVNNGGGLPDEGWHLAEVKEVTQKRSARGDLYYNLQLISADSKDFLSYDICMLEGRGNGIGLGKLKTLGLAKQEAAGWDVADADACVGARAWVFLYHEEYQGQKRTKVNISQGECGYQPSSWSPPKSSVPAGSADIDDDTIPF